MPIEFAKAADYLLDEANAEQIFRDFGEYFGSYTGRYFEQFVARSVPNKFTAEDLCAAASLSVPFTGEAAADLLIDRRDHFNALLNREGVPPFDADLRTVDSPDVADDSPLAALYTELKTLDQVSYVRASKLLGAKRPGLVPIRDSVVEEFLDAGFRWWNPYQDLVSLDGLAEQVWALSSDLPDDVSLLRRVDVALWMAGRRSLKERNRSAAPNDGSNQAG